MTTRALTVAAIAAVVLGVTSNAAAQAPAQPAAQAPAKPAAPAGPLTTTNPTWEVSGGYQWLTTDASPSVPTLPLPPLPTNPIYLTEDSEASKFPFGLAVDGARNFGALGIVAEGGWSVRSQQYGTEDVMFNFWHVAGGVRFSSRKNAKVWPYGQVLAGVSVHSQSGQIVIQNITGTLTETVDVGDTASHFMVQPGGGVTFVVGDGWGIFAAGDYRRVFLDEEVDGVPGVNEFRVFAGFRMILD